MLIAEFWEKAVLICKEFDGSMTSGVRSKQRNASVGGAGLSWHVAGLACDVVLDDPGRKGDFIQRAKAYDFPFILDEGDHIHLQGEK